MEFILLADDPLAYKQVARWYFDHWLSNVPGMSIEKIESKLVNYINRDKAPLLVLAKLGGELIGAAELKIREMDIYPEFEYWIGGVYVKGSFRGQGVASKLVKEVMARAKIMEVATLYLQTENLSGGLYLDNGFKVIEQVNYKGHDVVVMYATLDSLYL